MVQVLQCLLLLCVAVLGDTSVWPVDHSQFSVVKAVPDDNLQEEDSIADVAIHTVIQPRKMKYMEHEYTIEEEDLTAHDMQVPVRGRKLFRSCHGKCVQRSCLPVQQISVYSACVDKCRHSCL